MDLGLIGLGMMGIGLATRLLRGGHRVVVFDVSDAAIRTAESLGAEGATGPSDVTARLAGSRIVWLMLPAGSVTESTINVLAGHLSVGDVIVDGGNSHYRDSIRRAAELIRKGLQLVDVGTSGGERGLTNGYSLMAGGEPTVIERLRPIFDTLTPAPGHGWGRVGPVGAGHFAKMIHNGIEYGMMQAYAEGLSALSRKTEFGFDLQRVVDIWRPSAVTRSWLLDLVAQALDRNPELGSLAPYVADAGERRWTVDEAIDQVAQRGYDRWFASE